jgi:transposase-like protein
MKRRKWDAKNKATIVLQGFKGTSVAALCTEHQINQAQYYQRRDQFLIHAGKPLKSTSRANERRGCS